MENEVMEVVEVEVEKSSSGSSYFQFLSKKWILIVLVTIFTTLVGFALGVVFVKPVYTETTSVMLITDYTTASGNSASNSNKITLAQLYLPNIEMIMKSSDFIETTNQQYAKDGGKSEIKRSAIKIRYSDEGSLIFSISYSDSSYALAEEKLKAIVKVAKESLETKLVADSVELKETTNVNAQNMTYNYTSYIIVGFLLGLIAVVGYLTIVFLLDNTVKNREEIEKLTGVNVLAYIDALPDEVINNPNPLQPETATEQKQ